MRGYEETKYALTTTKTNKNSVDKQNARIDNNYQSNHQFEYSQQKNINENDEEDPWITKGEIEIRFLDEESENAKDFQGEQKLGNDHTDGKLWNRDSSCQDNNTKTLMK